MASSKGTIELGQHATETVILVVLGLACGAGGTGALAAILTQGVLIVQLPALSKVHNVRSLLPVRREEIISEVAVIVATQSIHLVSEACRQAQCQLGVPVIGDHQPKVQLYYGPCATLVHTQAALGQGGRQARALAVNLQRG